MNTQIINNSSSAANSMCKVTISLNAEHKEFDAHGRDVLAHVYYRIDVPDYTYTFNPSWDPERAANGKANVPLFFTEIVNILTADGWMLERDYGTCGRCPEMKKGLQRLYCHPQNISGDICAADVERLAVLFQDATSFKLRHVDNYGNIIITTSEDDERLLYQQTYPDGLGTYFQDALTTKRSNLYKSSMTIIQGMYSRVAVPNKRADLEYGDDSHAAYRTACTEFVNGEYSRLLNDGLIIEAQHYQQGTIARWLNKKEMKNWEKQQREKRAAEDAQEREQQRQQRAAELGTGWIWTDWNTADRPSLGDEICTVDGTRGRVSEIGKTANIRFRAADGKEYSVGAYFFKRLSPERVHTSWATDYTPDDFHKLQPRYEISEFDTDVMGRRFQTGDGLARIEVFVSDYAGNENWALIYILTGDGEVRANVLSLDHLRATLTVAKGWERLAA